jgi:hypothetical protein
VFAFGGEELVRAAIEIGPLFMMMTFAFGMPLGARIGPGRVLVTMSPRLGVTFCFFSPICFMARAVPPAAGAGNQAAFARVRCLSPPVFIGDASVMIRSSG